MIRRIKMGRGFGLLWVLGAGVPLAACSNGGGEMADAAGAMATPTAGHAGASSAAGAMATHAMAAAGAGGASSAGGGAGGAGGGVGGAGGAGSADGTSGADAADGAAGAVQSAGAGPTGGTPATTTDAGSGVSTPDADVDAGVPGDEHAPPCIDDPNDVVLIGDSYIDWITHTFVADIQAESGQPWPSYAIGGTSMATGGIGHIPDQLDVALSYNPDIKAIIMTGGGNDILVPDVFMFPDAGMCTSTPDAPMIEDCRAIVQAALEEAASLMEKTADAGVRDVVYFFYPHIPGGGLISGPTPNAILDYALPRAREVCESALDRTGGLMKCHFIDMVPVFEDKTGLFADDVSEAGDGVHPNSMGSKVMAEEVWRVMQQECIAQPSGSDCCAPVP